MTVVALNYCFNKQLYILYCYSYVAGLISSTTSLKSLLEIFEASCLIPHRIFRENFTTAVPEMLERSSNANAKDLQLKMLLSNLCRKLFQPDNNPRLKNVFKSRKII